MNGKSKRYLTFLLCILVAANAACSATPSPLQPLDGSIYGIRAGDRVPVRWSANGNSELVRIISVSYSGFSGTGEDGRYVSAEYDDTYEIGHKPEVDQPDEHLTGVAKAADAVLRGVSYTLLGAIAGAVVVAAPLGYGPP